MTKKNSGTSAVHLGEVLNGRVEAISQKTHGLVSKSLLIRRMVEAEIAKLEAMDIEALVAYSGKDS